MKIHLDTLPKLIKYNYEKYGDRKVAMRRKDLGIWNEYTWKESYEMVKYFSLGLLSIGFEKGDKLCIIGDNAPEGYWAEYAAQAAGGIPICLYTDAIHDEINYIASHSESKFAVAQDQEQVDKFLFMKNSLPKMEKIIYWDPKGMWAYSDPYLIYFYDVIEAGREYEKNHPNLFEANVESGMGSDIALLLYTSGTTGLPKGAIIPYDQLIKAGNSSLDLEPWFDTDNYVSYMSPAWITEQVHGLAVTLLTGATVNFVEEPETAMADIREIGPQMLIFGPRLWESLASKIQANISDTSLLKRWLYEVGVAIGYKISDMRQNNVGIGLFWVILHFLAKIAVLRPLCDKLGLINIRNAYTGGALLGPDVKRLFWALGVNLKDGYGLTELTPICLQRTGDVVLETLGIPLPHIEVRVSNKGEICFRSLFQFKGYYKNPQETQKTIDEQGWVHTGDAGFINENGHIVYTDRLTELETLKSGDKVAPQYLEARLRFNPYIKDAMVVGQDREYVTALIAIDYENVGRWAETKGIPYTTFTDLSQKQEVRNLIKSAIEKLNESLPNKYCILKFANLHKDFDPDEAELTRSRKLRRAYMGQRYEKIINAMYEGLDKITIETAGVYQDGRKIIQKAELAINSCRVRNV